MTERTRKSIVYATLPLALIWAFFNYEKKRTSPTAASSPQPAMQTIQPVARPTAATISLQDIENVRLAEWGEDPFRTTHKRVTAVPRANAPLAWTLGGIIYSNQAPIAFVNKKMVRIGDRVGEATVVDINKKSVILDLRGRRITLKLSKG